MTKPSAKLKKCPFCGVVPKQEEPEDNYFVVEHRKDCYLGFQMSPSIIKRWPTSGEPEGIRHWNRRAGTRRGK